MMSNYGKEQIYISDDERIIKRADAQALLRVARAAKAANRAYWNIDVYPPVYPPFKEAMSSLHEALKEVEHLL